MHDVEERLGQALRERFDPVKAPALPAEVLRRADRRHLGSIAGAAVITAVIAAIFVAALSSLAPLAGHKTAPAGQPGTTQGTSRATEPSVASIVYASSVGDHRGLFIANADGSGVRALVGGMNPLGFTLGGVGGELSPDGTKLVFATPSGIFVVATDGSSHGQLTKTAADIGADSNVDSYPAWSPDGTRIAYIHGCCGDSLGLMVMDADGTNVQRLTSGDPNVGQPTWSPDGSTIAFTEYGSKPLQLINADGSDLRTLGSPDAEEADWSPDGSQIAYMYEPNILVMHADGTSAHAITHVQSETRSTEHPRWSPDGTQIAYEWQGDIWVMDADGSNPHPVIQGPGEQAPTDWAMVPKESDP